MKVIALAGRRVATKFAATGRYKTYVQQTGCQIFQKVEMRHPPCGSPGLGGRILRSKKNVLIGVSG